MHRDKKVGLAMGILLVGIVAAFFFRNEPDPLSQVPPLEDALALDAMIAEKPVGPYITGLEPAASADQQWTLPEIYRKPDLSSGELPASAAAPEPINVLAPDEPPNVATNATSTPEPANDGWTGIEETPTPASTVETPPLTAASQSVPLPPQEIPKEIPPVKPELPAKPAVPSPTAPLVYKVQIGDTLSGIAWRHLGSSRRYMEIFEANRDQLRHPDDLRADMVIRIPPRDASRTDATANAREDVDGHKKFVPARSPLEPVEVKPF